MRLAATFRSGLRSKRLHCAVASCLFAAILRAQSACAGCPDGAVARSHAVAGRTSTNGAAATDPEIKSLINDADGVPPEFKADILLGLAESGKISDQRLRKTLVNKAFTAAASVEPEYGEGVFGVVGETRTGRKAIALQATQLDRMSLQSRAVRDMQMLDPARARALFEQLRFPVLEPLGCDNDWLYDPSNFYNALAEVLNNDFRSDEVATGKRLAFLMPFVSHLESQSQVIPVAHLLAASKLTTDELRQLLPAYEEALATVPQDQLTFAEIADDGGEYVRSVYGESSLSDTMLALEAVLKKSGAPVGPLLRSLRGYLVQNFNGPRCDTTKDGQGTKQGALPAAVASFNQEFGPQLLQNGLTPIHADELSKSAVVKSAAFDPPPLSYDSHQLTIAIQQLHTSRDQLTRGGKVDPSWWAELDSFLSRFYSWQQGDEAEVDYLHEKAQFYTALLRLIPESPQWNNVLENFVRFMEQHSYQNVGGAEWFVYAKVLLGSMHAADSHDEVLNAFLGSRDPVLSLYARMEVWRAKPPAAVRASTH